MRIEFWGGPKDGEVVYTFGTPKTEFICMENTEIPIDIIKFHNDLEHHPQRTQKYHKYSLKFSDQPRNCSYVYDGIL